MKVAKDAGIGLRPASPQPSKRHGRDPLTFTWCKLETLAATTEEAKKDHDSDDSDPIETVTDSSSSSGNANAAVFSPFEAGDIATSHQGDWYRFPAPTQLDARRSRPYVDNVTRLEARLLAKAPASSQGGGGGGGSTKWDFKMVGQWRVGEMLGKGTSGQVRLVRSIESGVFAAMKRVIHLPNDHKHAHSIHREVCIMKLAANHPHLLQLYDIYETAEHYYILTEYTELGELFQYVQQNLLLPQYVHRYFCQLISAVAHLARFRICHRDIKLENIMMWRDEDGEVSIKLIDFGMATYQPEGELLTMSCGSPHYAAPEIMEGFAYDGIKSDTWSCGVVLYAMIARKLPFDDDDIPTLMNKVRIGHYEMPLSVQEEARDLISLCLVKDPAERITLPELLAHPFIVQPIDPPPHAAFRVFGRVEPPRAAYKVNEPLVEDIVSDVAMLLGIEDTEVVEKQIRLPLNTHARIFYLVFLGYRTPSLVAKEDEQQPLLKSCFDSSGPSCESAYASTASTRRSSSSPAVASPPPPLDEKDTGDALVLAPRRSVTGSGKILPENINRRVPSQAGGRPEKAVTSSASDAPASSRAWNALLTEGFVFPKPSPATTSGTNSPDSPPREKQSDPGLALDSAAPPQTAPVANDLPAIVPAVLKLSPSGSPSLRDLYSRGRLRIDGADYSSTIPVGSVPTSSGSAIISEAISPAEAAAVAPDSGTPSQQVRPKASIHQRLRSIFSAPHVRQKSTASAPSLVEKASADPATTGQPRTRRPRPHPISVRWSVSDAVAEVDTEDERSPTSTHSAHSSLLKRSDAYTSFERAFAGNPPVSPGLFAFGAILEKGASGPADDRVKGRGRSPARTKPTFEVYEDPEEANECTATPRASALNKQVLSPRGSIPAAEEVDVKGWRLLRKASSHVVGRVRQTVASRPTSLVMSSRTEDAARTTPRRPVSQVPTVTIEFASPPEANQNAKTIPLTQDVQTDAKPVHPWRSSTSTLSEAGDRIGRRWRRSSLSIQLPSIEPREGEGASTTFSPAFDLCTPTSISFQDTTHSDGARVTDTEELSRSLQQTEMENRMLRISLQDKVAELELLCAREQSLADCLRTGNDMVRELSEERDELEDRLRRISWYSCGGDPAWLGGGAKPGGGGGGGSQRNASDSSPEAKWLGSSRRSPFQDEASA